MSSFILFNFFNAFTVVPYFAANHSSESPSKTLCSRFLLDKNCPRRTKVLLRVNISGLKNETNACVLEGSLQTGVNLIRAGDGQLFVEGM